MTGSESANGENMSHEVVDDIRKRPFLFSMLAEKALSVAESMRDNYVTNTASFIGVINQIMLAANQGKRSPILTILKVISPEWSDVKGEIVTFLDGGIGQVDILRQVPIFLRVGSYRVDIGNKDIYSREQFGYYPVIFGDLEGGSKERKDFTDIVRITAELLGGLSALDRTPDLRLLMFHGPLVYHVGRYIGHTPFTEKDVDKFLLHYGDSNSSKQMKDEFLYEASVHVYPRMTSNFEKWIRLRLFEPLAWMSYLYRRLVRLASQRTPVPIIVGAVERGDSKEMSTIILDRIFHNMRINMVNKGSGNFFNDQFKRNDLNTTKAVQDRLGYDDNLLMTMLLHPEEYTESWVMQKYQALKRDEISLPDESVQEVVDYSVLKDGSFGFPNVLGSYLCVSETTEPIRIEVFQELGESQINEAARRVFLYSRLLPGYGFPVGLDIADKFAHVPNWLTDAYSKLIKFQLGVSLQRGEISDADMRRILVQSIYITHRDWLFRPRN